MAKLGPRTLGVLTTSAVALGTILALSSQLAYWTAFDIDALRYMEIIDVLKNGLTYALIFPFQQLIIVFISREAWTEERISRLLTVRRVMLSSFCLGLGLLIVSSVLQDHLSGKSRAEMRVGMYTCFAIGTGFQLLIAMARAESSHAVFSQKWPTTVMAFCLVLGSIISIRTVDAYNVIQDSNVNVVKKISFAQPQAGESFVGLKYIGTIRDRIFLLGRNGSDIIILNSDVVAAIEIGELELNSSKNGSLMAGKLAGTAASSSVIVSKPETTSTIEPSSAPKPK